MFNCRCGTILSSGSEAVHHVPFFLPFPDCISRAPAVLSWFHCRVRPRAQGAPWPYGDLPVTVLTEKGVVVPERLRGGSAARSFGRFQSVSLNAGRKD